ncbi:MFS transporter [Psychromarinibacter sp. C21-152]|uniref:MFS transporter n=1 Tax=Psychromarinibacter sediminicola TaxID=3033385 RepID=A0AAE3NQ93_9RHOB|nr:MFS transporter [Psychromarinibacter sediminicola]MDF0600454.1 MFS transporter [Psychromarinibacter sediminicola]
MRRLLAPLANAVFLRLWAAYLTATLGGMMQAVAAAWLMMEMTGSPAMVAFVQSCITLPLVAFSLIAGVLADVYDRRRIMLAAQGVMGLVSAVLAGLAFADALTPGRVLLFTFLIGCGGAVHIPAWHASVRDIVGRRELAQAVALNSMGFNVMRSVGPAVGGALLAATGAAAVFAANALTYLAPVAALLAWRPGPRAGPPPAGPLHRALTDGLRQAAGTPALLRIMLRGAVFCASGVAVLALLPVVAARLLAGDAALFGTLLASFGAGAVLGAILNPPLRARMSNEAIVRLAFAAMAAACLLLVSGAAWAAFAGALLAGTCWVTANALFNVTIQLMAPEAIVGRALSVHYTGIFGGMALGAWAWGLVAEAQGTATALVAAAVLMCAGAALGLRLPLPDPASEPS